MATTVITKSSTVISGARVGSTSSGGTVNLFTTAANSYELLNVHYTANPGGGTSTITINIGGVQFFSITITGGSTFSSQLTGVVVGPGQQFQTVNTVGIGTVSVSVNGVILTNS